jgi:hypothetical protein
MLGAGIDRNHALLVSQFAEARQPCHVVCVLIHAMKQNYYGIFSIVIVTPRQPH